VIPFEGGLSAIKLTTATYWRPSGENIHRQKEATDQDAWGVRPDPEYAVLLTDEELRKVVDDRRRRDYGPLSQATELPDTGANNEGFFDPQLDKAIEAISQQVRRKDESTGT
jgi:carboxyl-terminal processing protease